MRHTFSSLLLVMLCLVGCQKAHPDWSGHRCADEANALSYLATARERMRARDFAAAEAAIDSLRQYCPLALDGRKRGIIVADSIALLQAQEKLMQCDAQMIEAGECIPDSMKLAYEDLCRKVKFYQRKIKHDSHE